ncbi:Low-affinity inorganic phosphate transporter 1 [Buchnera aphidicola (Neophyllaphis podocarpi)]|uniref:inorganic phosphate transporter n=1 Tax=Buchnera aphidicola TaxID=9 RepID=UPI0031B849C5
MIYLFKCIDLYNDLIFIIAFLFVLFYEAINGFHDTANAVAIVIYTKTMKSNIAVIMSGIFNFLGVLLGGLSVAYTIVHLFPINLLIEIYSINGLVIIFSILSSAITWNLFTWYFCLPSSSSHALIGSIIGISITDTFIRKSSLLHAMNLNQIFNVLSSLIFSPIVGLLISIIFIILLNYFIKNKLNIIYSTPYKNKKEKNKAPLPLIAKIALIISSIGVSYSHGANDGQKGIGLIMLVLIGISPSFFLVDLNLKNYDIIKMQTTIKKLKKYYLKNERIFISQKKILKPLITNIKKEKDKNTIKNCYLISYIFNDVHDLVKKSSNYKKLNLNQKKKLRMFLLCITDLNEHIYRLSNISLEDRHFLMISNKNLLKTVEYAPTWIILSIAFSLSIGTMIGWKRISNTISTRIGKKNMTYAQAIASQMTAAISIGVASYTGIPVSTTHILSSSVAGTMIADKIGIQFIMVKNIILAWIFTLPISMFLSSLFYLLVLNFI